MGLELREGDSVELWFHKFGHTSKLLLLCHSELRMVLILSLTFFSY